MNKAKKTQLFLSLLVITITLSLSISYRPTTSAVNGSSAYVGAEQCAVCHAEKHAGWNQTAHANMAGIHEINASGTFYWVAFPSRVMNQSSFIEGCAGCHVTGWDPETQTWPNWNSTDPDLAGKFLNVQCEVCHGPGTEEPWGVSSMLLNYSSALCGQCHTQYSDWQLSAHNESLAGLRASDHAGDSCVICHSTQAFVDNYNFSTYVQNVIGEITLANPELESITCSLCHNLHSPEYEYQLRFENSTELCGQCHTGSHHPQSEFFNESPHEKAELECASCHGQGTRLFHGREGSWFNHTFQIYNTFYPYNQTEPLVCSSCHTQSWATSQLGVIQGLTTELITNVTQAIENAKESIDTANQTSGVSQENIAEAQAMIETAEDYVHFVENDHSEGFHNPEQTFAILGEAAHLANEAQLIVFESLAGQTSTLEDQVSSLQNQITSLQNQTTTLQTDIENLEAKIDDLESASAMAPYLYGGLGLAVGFIIGAAIIFLTRRGKS